MLQITKKIVYDPVTKDFLLELDNQPVGYAATRADAERVLDALVFERLRRFAMPGVPVEVEGEGDQDG